MDQHHVFIPSRGRAHNAAILQNSWHQEGFQVHFVVEPDETLTYASRVESSLVHRLPRPNMGIGFSRNHCVSIAASYGMRSMILADDDIKPGRNANMKNLVECASHSKVLGITAEYSYHGLCLGDIVKERDDLILLPTGAFRLVSLNVNNVLNLGNYDKTLEYAEDCDLFLRGLQAGYPWMVHLGTWSNSIGNRYEPGGMLDFAHSITTEPLHVMKKEWHVDLYSKWPDFVNDPDRVKDWTKQNTIRVAWKRAYDKFLPDWEEWSAIHGGHINNYFGLVR